MNENKNAFKLKHTKKQITVSGLVYVYNRITDDQGRLYCYEIIDSISARTKNNVKTKTW